MKEEKVKKKIQENYDLLVDASSQTGIHPAWIAGMALIESGLRSHLRAFNNDHLLRYAKKFGESAAIPELKKQRLHIGPHGGGKKTYMDHLEKFGFFERAFAIAPKAAISATAWGTFQVLGRQLLKIYPDPQEAWAEFQKDSAGVSMKMLVKFTEANRSKFVESTNKAVETGDMKYFLFTTDIYFGRPVRSYANKLKKYAEVFKELYPGVGPEVKPKPEKTKAAAKKYKERILFIGDSGTSYQVQPLIKKFKTEERDVKVLYKNGASSKWWYETLFSALTGDSKQKTQKKIAAEIKEYNPTSIRVVTLGGNDACYSTNPKRFSNYVSKYVIGLANRVDEWGGPPPVGPEAVITCRGKKYNYQKRREIINKTYKWVLARVGKKYYDAMATGAYGKVKGDTHHHGPKTYKKAANTRRLKEIKKLIFTLQSEILNG